MEVPVYCAPLCICSWHPNYSFCFKENFKKQGETEVFIGKNTEAMKWKSEKNLHFTSKNISMPLKPHIKARLKLTQPVFRFSYSFFLVTESSFFLHSNKQTGYSSTFKPNRKPSCFTFHPWLWKPHLPLSSLCSVTLCVSATLLCELVFISKTVLGLHLYVFVHKCAKREEKKYLQVVLARNILRMMLPGGRAEHLGTFPPGIIYGRTWNCQNAFPGGDSCPLLGMERAVLSIWKRLLKESNGATVERSGGCDVTWWDTSWAMGY